MTTIPLPASLNQSGGFARPALPLQFVSMVRASTEPGGRDRFACSQPAWNLLLQVAEAFGWKPRGTSYSSSRPAFIESPVRHDYQPGDSRDQKRVEMSDSLSWAIALNEARHSPRLAAMVAASTIDAADAPFNIVMDEFIAYAFGGAFSFARQD